MKKENVYLKALIGIPLGVFTLEIFNMIISIWYGKYIRIEYLLNGGSLIDIILLYIFCMLSSYLLAIHLYSCIETSKMELGISQKQKENNKCTVTVLITIFVLGILSIITRPESLSILGIMISFIWSGIAMVIYAFKNLLDKHTIKEINSKLKMEKKSK